MEQHAGIDMSLEWSSVCIVDASSALRVEHLLSLIVGLELILSAKI
jgi:hypothetical protein